MARVSPLLAEHESAGAVVMPYGPEGDGIPVVQVYSGIDREYAAIRKGAAILDLPQRAMLAVTGPDRLSFLNRMITQELKGLEPASGASVEGGGPFAVRRSFWLNRKGRIDADLTVIGLPDRIVLEVDAHAANRAVEGLSSYIIADDVRIEPAGESVQRLTIHGPEAAAVLGRVTRAAHGLPKISSLRPGEAGLYGAGEVMVWRHDWAGEAGYEISLPTAMAGEMYRQLAEPGSMVSAERAEPQRGFGLHSREGGQSATGRAVRAGWHAFNIARIEAGTAMYYLDFGPDSLPHETGEETLSDRVSFTKGCYLGQEIVARMQSLGHPKQRLVALDCPEGPAAADPGEPGAQAGAEAAQPVTGSRITEGPDPSAEGVGAVTSSAISPMLGSKPVCFAMMKFKHTTQGSAVHVQAEGGRTLRGVVRGSMVYWRRPN